MIVYHFCKSCHRVSTLCLHLTVYFLLALDQLAITHYELRINPSSLLLAYFIFLFILGKISHTAP